MNQALKMSTIALADLSGLFIFLAINAKTNAIANARLMLCYCEFYVRVRVRVKARVRVSKRDEEIK